MARTRAPQAGKRAGAAAAPAVQTPEPARVLAVGIAGSAAGAVRDASYKSAIARLVERIALARAATWSPTPTRKRLQKLAKDLHKLADGIWADDSVRTSLGFEMMQRDGSGRPVEVCPIGTLRAVGYAAESAAAALPSSKKDPVLPDAALCFIHVWWTHGRGRPTAYRDGPAFVEFCHILQLAGVQVAAETAFLILCAALKRYDPHMPPAGFDM